MFRKLAVKLTSKLLSLNDLALEDRVLLTSLLLDKLAAIPLGDIISYDKKGTLLVNNRPLTLEQASALRESAKGMLNNYAFRLVSKQTTYEAYVMGINKANSLNDLFFSKSAIWYGQQVQQLLKTLAQEGDEIEG